MVIQEQICAGTVFIEKFELLYLSFFCPFWSENEGLDYDLVKLSDGK
jgi:hypothetical protein